MHSWERGRGVGLWSMVAALICASAPSDAVAAGATRDLATYGDPGVAFTVSITLDPPPDTQLAGVEDSPPAGWITINNISHGGLYDPQSHKVKWGPFWSPEEIPAVVTYDITPPADALGSSCFSGIVFYYEGTWDITGDECIAIGIPTVSQWGLAVMALLVLVTGTVLMKRRRAALA